MGNFPFGASIDPDQVPASQYGLTAVPQASAMTSFFAALANRNAARADIPVIGDSVTEGNGATVLTSRYATQLNRAIRAAYPSAAAGTGGGLGFIPVASTGETTFTWPVTQSGGAGWDPEQPVGPVRGATAMSEAGSFAFTAPAGTTSVQVMYYGNGDGSEFSWEVDSGGATTVTVAGTGDGALTGSITITGTQVLTIAWVSGTVYMEGIVHYAGDEDSGITFHALGHFGWQAGQAGDFDAWNQTGFGPDFAWQPAVAALTPGAAALAVMLGINDAASYTAGGFQANLLTLISGLRATAGLGTVPLLLIIPYQPFETTVTPGWAAYTAAIRAAAAAAAPAHVIDLNYRMPPVPSGGGTYYTDDFHPDDLGHALAGEIAAGCIRVA